MSNNHENKDKVISENACGEDTDKSRSSKTWNHRKHPRLKMKILFEQILNGKYGKSHRSLNHTHQNNDNVNPGSLTKLFHPCMHCSLQSDPSSSQGKAHSQSKNPQHSEAAGSDSSVSVSFLLRQQEQHSSSSWTECEEEAEVSRGGAFSCETSKGSANTKDRMRMWRKINIYSLLLSIWFCALRSLRCARIPTSWWLSHGYVPRSHFRSEAQRTKIYCLWTRFSLVPPRDWPPSSASLTLPIQLNIVHFSFDLPILGPLTPIHDVFILFWELSMSLDAKRRKEAQNLLRNESTLNLHFCITGHLLLKKTQAVAPFSSLNYDWLCQWKLIWSERWNWETQSTYLSHLWLFGSFLFIVVLFFSPFLAWLFHSSQVSFHCQWLSQRMPKRRKNPIKLLRFVLFHITFPWPASSSNSNLSLKDILLFLMLLSRFQATEPSAAGNDMEVEKATEEKVQQEKVNKPKRRKTFEQKPVELSITPTHSLRPRKATSSSAEASASSSNKKAGSSSSASSPASENSGGASSASPPSLLSHQCSTTSSCCCSSSSSCVSWNLHRHVMTLVQVRWFLLCLHSNFIHCFTVLHSFGSSLVAE